MTDASVNNMKNNTYNNMTEDERIEWFLNTKFTNGNTDMVATDELLPVIHVGDGEVCSCWPAVPSFKVNSVSNVLRVDSKRVNVYLNGYGHVTFGLVKYVEFDNYEENEPVVDWMKRLIAECGQDEYIRLSGCVLTYNEGTDEFVSGTERFKSDRFVWNSNNDEGEELVIIGDGIVLIDKVTVIDWD